MTSPQPWRVERGFETCRILAADDSVVADGLSLEDASAIVAAMAVAEKSVALYLARMPDVPRSAQWTADEEWRVAVKAFRAAGRAR
jgi:hypothetical protein